MRVTGTGVDGNEPASWLSVRQLDEVERAFHRDSPVQTLVAEVRALRGRVAYLERFGEFYRRRGERFRDERNEARGRVAALEGQIKRTADFIRDQDRVMAGVLDALLDEEADRE